VQVAAICGLIFVGKDFGTPVVICSVVMIMLFASGLPKRYFGILMAICIPLMIAAVWFERYRLERIIAFLNPWKSIQESGFQLYQSFLAFGSGGFAGVGLGQSQQKLFYLPAAHTDFIYAIIGEEAGFVGACSVIILFAGLMVLGMMVAFRAETRFGQLAALGFTSLVTMEALLNIGVSIGALPTKGLALPFISYGGSSLVAKMLLIGCLLNIARYPRRKDIKEVN